MILMMSVILLLFLFVELKVRREKISERMKLLQDLVPGCNKVGNNIFINLFLGIII